MMLDTSRKHIIISIEATMQRTQWNRVHDDDCEICSEARSQSQTNKNLRVIYSARQKDFTVGQRAKKRITLHGNMKYS